MNEDDANTMQQLGVHLMVALHDPSGPFRCWNSPRRPLRPLLFALRAQIMILTPPPGTTFRALLSHVDPPVLGLDLDFMSEERQEKPWELAFADLHSRHRLHFAIATSRGLGQGKPNLRTICTFALSITLAKGTLSSL